MVVVSMVTVAGATAVCPGYVDAGVDGVSMVAFQILTSVGVVLGHPRILGWLLLRGCWLASTIHFLAVLPHVFPLATPSYLAQMRAAGGKEVGL